MKDNFSIQSQDYAKYRPNYPAAFFGYLNTIVANKQKAWDCGTGNGQVAFELAKSFHHVYATDISNEQLKYARQAGNITYSVQPAEQTNFLENQFDLVVAAQAIHWFRFDEFYEEVKRTSKRDGLLCVLGYGKIIVSEKVDDIINNFYKNVIGTYWDKERRYIDENYQTIPFPFKEIETPNFVNKLQWNLGHLIGYINTWSAVKHFIKQKAYNPVDDLQKELEQHWSRDEIKEVQFPLLLRLGKVFDS